MENLITNLQIKDKCISFICGNPGLLSFQIEDSETSITRLSYFIVLFFGAQCSIIQTIYEINKRSYLKLQCSQSQWSQLETFKRQWFEHPPPHAF